MEETEKNAKISRVRVDSLKYGDIKKKQGQLTKM